MVACSGCGVILFVDLDGNLQVSGDTPAAEAAADEPAPAQENPVFAAVPAESFAPAEPAEDFSPADEAAPSADFENSPIQFDYATEEPVAETFAPTPEEAPGEYAPAQDAIVEEPAVNSEFAQNAFDAPEPAAASPADQLREVVDFGNSPAEEGHALQYTLTITGIDSKETRDRMFEVLTDVRLGLNVRELQTQVVRGALEIPQLNPVRASVIVGRLRELPLKLNWRQDVWQAN